MSFFKDFKDDLSQAVNELMPEDKNQVADDVQMVDTLTEDNDVSEPSIEEMLNNIEHMDLDSLTAETSSEAMPEEEVIEEAFAEETFTEKESEVSMETAVEEPAIEEPAAIIEETVFEEHEEFIEELEETQEKETEYIEQEVTRIMDEERATFTNESAATDETGVITLGMEVKGDIKTEGSLEVTGSIQGNLDIKGKLVITGVINGDSKAAEVFADAAKITGEIASLGSVKIGQNTVVKGNIKATSAVLAGAIKGDIDVQGPVILDTTAIIMGNIKSKSIQINNGAVIEGMCSQCYADVSPTNFFEDEKDSKAKK
ncbi:MAG TPA: polymer-forming cytoskeletal protein [Lachnospiraceae bacterium]|nr:polymer-forming cytoskeletal protein [Lachnospiraceae bacterium]